MGKAKKKPDPSLKGKKPINTAMKARRSTKQPQQSGMVLKNPSHISNKLKRSEMYGKYLQQKRSEKKEARKKRADAAEALGEDIEVKKATPKTLDNTREVEPTLVSTTSIDAEIEADEADDEFAPYFAGATKPKVLITTRPRPSKMLFYFIADLQKLIPGLHFYPRKQFTIKEICQFATNRNFTHLIILSEKAKKCNGMMVSHLSKHDGIQQPGPTAFFKLTNVVTSQNIPHHGASTSHIPELNLHGFGTRLGHRIGRLLGSLFPHDAQFEGRQVVTFHNQRDYIFVRQHRYIFRERPAEKKADKETEQNGPPVKTKLQELGPRFTIKLRWLQEGTFDTKFGEYEWIHKRKEMDVSRRKFHL